MLLAKRVMMPGPEEREVAPSPKNAKTNTGVADDYALFQKLRSSATIPSHTPDAGIDPEKRGQIHQSLKQWENSKQTLTEIQGLLVQAYQELELMKVEN